MTADGHTKGCVDRSALHEVASGILKSTYEGQILSPRVIMKETADLAHHAELFHIAEKVIPKITSVSCPAAIWPFSAGNDYPATAAHFAVDSLSTMPKEGHDDDYPDDDDPGDDYNRESKRVAQEVFSSDEE